MAIQEIFKVLERFSAHANDVDMRDLRCIGTYCAATSSVGGGIGLAAGQMSQELFDHMLEFYGLQDLGFVVFGQVNGNSGSAIKLQVDNCHYMIPNYYYNSLYFPVFKEKPRIFVYNGGASNFYFNVNLYFLPREKYQPHSRGQNEPFLQGKSGPPGTNFERLEE